MRTVLSRDEDDCRIQEWRWLLSPGMKTTVVWRNEADSLFFRDVVYIADFYLKKWRCRISQGTRHAGIKLTGISFRLSSNVQCSCQTHDQRGTFGDWIPTQCPRHTHSGSVPPPHSLRRSDIEGHTLSCCIFKGNSNLTLNQGLWLVQS